ncbi:hypothetical protein HELRODRAFT_193432 [Helobdella robusta]|uniref:Anaphase-promoting complex subunit 5 n=1 Tax=Helobdella robusta TaxID=6412 RepID=T1FUZ3_HELRO|nr:hypothetical protein HELRODRAFT_193432 [Helobdella robusta]ESN95926.1 hypothetical protein HELRODRAFT_193432 [Helobdella robusta]
MSRENFLIDRSSQYKDFISPYKVVLLVFLQEHAYVLDTMSDDKACDLMITILKLIQEPDMNLKDLILEISLVLPEETYQKILKSIHDLCTTGPDSLFNLMQLAPTTLLTTPLSTLVKGASIYTTSTDPCLNKSSMLEISKLYKKLNSMYRRALNVNQLSEIADHKMGEESFLSNSRWGRGLENWSDVIGRLDFRARSLECHSDLIGRQDSGGGDKFESVCPGGVGGGGEEEDDDDGLPVLKRYSHRQADQFITQQANLLSSNELYALPPKELHKKLNELLTPNNEFPEAHYLKFMNFLRVREYNETMNCLYNYFDRNLCCPSTNSSSSSSGGGGAGNSSKNNKSWLQKLGMEDCSGERINECGIIISHNNVSSCCSSHNNVIIHSNNNDDDVGNDVGYTLDKLIRSSREFELPELTSLACQSYAKHAYFNGAKPEIVMKMMMLSDTINSDHSLTDIICVSLSQKAALWNLYGFNELCKLNCLALLNMPSFTTSSSSSPSSSSASPATRLLTLQTTPTVYQNGESECLALCHLCWMLTEQGSYPLVDELMNMVKSRFPQMSNYSHIWMFWHQRITFEISLRRGEFSQSEKAIQSIAHVNGLESSYCRCLYYFETGQSHKCLQLVDVLIGRCKNRSYSVHVNHLLIRCLLLKSLCSTTSQSDPSSSTTQPIIKALQLTNKYHYHYLGAMATLHLAHYQMRLKIYHNALELIQRCLPTILQSSSVFDQARTLFLYVRCKMAAHFRRNWSCSGDDGGVDDGDDDDGVREDFVEDEDEDEKKHKILLPLAHIMKTVCDKFLQVQAHNRLKDALAFQAMMYNELGMEEECNGCSSLYLNILNRHHHQSQQQHHHHKQPQQQQHQQQQQQQQHQQPEQQQQHHYHNLPPFFEDGSWNRSYYSYNNDYNDDDDDGGDDDVGRYNGNDGDDDDNRCYFVVF